MSVGSEVVGKVVADDADDDGVDTEEDYAADHEDTDGEFGQGDGLPRHDIKGRHMGGVELDHWLTELLSLYNLLTELQSVPALFWLRSYLNTIPPSPPPGQVSSVVTDIVGLEGEMLNLLISIVSNIIIRFSCWLLAHSSYSRHDLLRYKVMMQKAWCFMRSAWAL